MWYVQKEDGFTREELLKLYILVENREKNFRDDLYRFVNFYSAVCYAVLGLTLSGVFTLYAQKGRVSLLLLFGPILAVLICFLGLRVVSRTYRRIMEEIAYKAKLEHLLGLDGVIPVQECLGEGTPWQEDAAVISTRHANRRNDEASSTAFVNASSKRGIARDLRLYFGLIGLFSFLLVAVIVVVRFAG
jgi:hypothetical protein